MKKMIIVLIITLVSSQNKASVYYPELQTKNNNSKNCFLDASQMDEYGHNNDESCLDEYDQHVCDDVQPPKISAAKALLTEILGSALVRYIILREWINGYCRKIKGIISAWFICEPKA
ncbi:MAG TPA: hypothetical protein VLB80_00165 [Candidatus Babeliales bacterium]|nr:hypothetical protein [Candidatus Babeliales bacterium]